MQEQTSPRNKTELVERINAARAALDGTLSGLSDEALTRPGTGGGWSVKDHLAHLNQWRWKLLAMIEGRPPHQALGIDQATYAAGLDAINARLYERDRDRPLAEILAESRRAHQAVLDAIAGMEEADLSRAYNLDDPTDSRILLEGIAGNTYEHDLEHRQWIIENLPKE